MHLTLLNYVVFIFPLAQGQHLSRTSGFNLLSTNSLESVHLNKGFMSTVNPSDCLSGKQRQDSTDLELTFISSQGIEITLYFWEWVNCSQDRPLKQHLSVFKYQPFPESRKEESVTEIVRLCHNLDQASTEWRRFRKSRILTCFQGLAKTWRLSIVGRPREHQSSNWESRWRAMQGFIGRSINRPCSRE